MYEVNRKLLQEHAAPLMAVYLHGVAVVRQELNMDVGRKSITGKADLHSTLQCLSWKMRTSLSLVVAHVLLKESAFWDGRQAFLFWNHDMHSN